MDVKDTIKNFVYKPDGTTTFVDALCSHLREEMAFGRLKGGSKFPTMAEISEMTGLTFGRARRVIECLSREGYLCSKQHVGTYIVQRSSILRGRVLFALPDVDTCRYHPCQLTSVLGRRLMEKGYSFSIATFPLDPKGDLSYLKSELLRATNLVIAARATPQVQKLLAESGVKHVFLYGDTPETDVAPWVRFAPEEAISRFADHCAKAGVKHVVQVRFENNETLDAGPALAERGIESSWMTVSREKGGKARFDGVVRCAYDAFVTMPRKELKELYLIWNSFLAQGAITAFLVCNLHLPEDLKMVALSDTGVAPVYNKSITSFELDPLEAGEKVARFVLSILTKGRIPRVPKIEPKYCIGSTFPL